MSARFIIPDWMQRAEPPQPPDLSSVDPHRVESLVNRFIAGKQDALFTAPGALYRQTGADAVDGAPAVLDRLAGLRQSTLDQAQDDNERTVLGPRLDLHIDDARDGIDRHVTKQQDALTRQTIAERQRLIQRAAELDHNNDDKLAGLAEAHASAAQELARMNGAPEEPAAQSARSAIWRTALGQRLTNGDGTQTIALFDRIKDQLAPADRRALDGPMANAATNVATDAWIAREDARPGEPLDARASADPALSPLERATIMAKVAVRDSAREARRVATVMGTDDKFAAATRAIATAPATYRAGTIAALASAYEEAGEPAKAASTRHIALLEGALLPFARGSTEGQQRFIDSLPEGDPTRAAAEAIQRHQADAFARDAFAAGTALYPDVGAPTPIHDVEKRIAQARMIAERRSIPMAPFTAGEIASIRVSLADGPPEERHLLLTHLKALPDDMKAALARAEESGSPGHGSNSVLASLTTSPQKPKSWHLPRDIRPSEPLDPPPRPLPVPPGRQPPFFTPLPTRPDPPPPVAPPRPPEAPEPAPGHDIAFQAG